MNRPKIYIERKSPTKQAASRGFKQNTPAGDIQGATPFMGGACHPLSRIQEKKKRNKKRKVSETRTMQVSL